jgi:hypothetical protein
MGNLYNSSISFWDNKTKDGITTLVEMKVSEREAKEFDKGLRQRIKKLKQK